MGLTWINRTEFQQATLNIITLTLQHDDKLSYVIWNKISNINLTFSESIHMSTVLMKKMVGTEAWASVSTGYP